MDKRLIGILVFIAAIFIGIAVVTSHSKSNSSGSNSSGAQPTNHVEGLGQKNVTLVEYGDFECPVCEQYYQPVKQVVAKYNNDIYFQFRNLPIVQIHPNAFAAARAAEAAALQGKFWQMHDKLYENQSSWAPPVTNVLPIFDQYAKDIGLNVSQFNTDYSSSQVNNSINADVAAFNKTGQTEGTPSFFLNGKFIPYSKLIDQTNFPSADKFSAVIDAAIAQKAKQ